MCGGLGSSEPAAQAIDLVGDHRGVAATGLGDARGRAGSPTSPITNAWRSSVSFEPCGSSDSSASVVSCGTSPPSVSRIGAPTGAAVSDAAATPAAQSVGVDQADRGRPLDAAGGRERRQRDPGRVGGRVGARDPGRVLGRESGKAELLGRRSAAAPRPRSRRRPARSWSSLAPVVASAQIAPMPAADRDHQAERRSRADARRRPVREACRHRRETLVDTCLRTALT